MSDTLSWAEPGTWSHWTRRQVYEAGWWSTAEARRVADKRVGKAWAQSMGLRVARLLGPTCPCVVKRTEGSGCAGMEVYPDPSAVVIEELLTGWDGRCPPMDVRFYCFAGEALFVETCWHDFSRPSERLREVRYFWLHDGSIADVDRVHRPDGAALSLPPAALPQMRRTAEKLARQFALPFLRVDLYLTEEGVFFGELCATPGLIMGRWIRPEWDRWLGDVLEKQIKKY